MYCSSCGVVVAQGLSYCNYCGAKLNGEKSDTASKASELRPVSLVWAMVAVLVFGLVGIVFLMLAMKMVGLNEAIILAFTLWSFLLILLIEGVFIWKLLRSKPRGATPAETGYKDPSTSELDAARVRVLPEPMPSVTEHTTRAFDPIYSERKSK